MSEVKVVLNRQGVSELLKSDEMMEVCVGYASNALSRLGEGYKMTTHVDDRVNASICTETYKAMRENMKNNSILKALRG